MISGVDALGVTPFANWNAVLPARRVLETFQTLILPAVSVRIGSPLGLPGEGGRVGARRRRVAGDGGLRPRLRLDVGLLIAAGVETLVGRDAHPGGRGDPRDAAAVDVELAVAREGDPAADEQSDVAEAVDGRQGRAVLVRREVVLLKAEVAADREAALDLAGVAEGGIALGDDGESVERGERVRAGRVRGVEGRRGRDAREAEGEHEGGGDDRQRATGARRRRGKGKRHGGDLGGISPRVCRLGSGRRCSGGARTGSHR
jgi:hypothetical protein